MRLGIPRTLSLWAALVLLASCSSDDNATTPGPVVLDRPPIPEPTYYAGPVPARSIELVLATVQLPEFVAAADSIWTPWCSDGGDFECVFYATTADGRRIDLVQADSSVTDPAALMTEAVYAPFSWGEMAVSPLSSRPYLQHVRYWARQGDVERYSGSTSVTVTRTITRGVEQTEAEEFGMSIGMEASVSGGFFVDFSVTLRTEFSYSSSTEFSVSEEVTDEESFSITCPDDRNIVYCVWQLIDEFRIVGADGEPFTDPGYRLAAGSLRTVCPTADFVPMTTYFSNP